MKKIPALLAALATIVFASACTSAAPEQSAASSTSSGSAASAASSEASPSGQPADFNDADVMFATMMIPHHQQAVELSALAPERSTNPELLTLAAGISAAQAPEIETMKVFLVQWNAGESGMGDMSGMPGMGGTSGMAGMADPATMDRLKALEGPEFDTLWLQTMIGHHEGAIEMADTEVRDGKNADAKKLAQQIADTQRAEIDQMKQMLGQP